MGSSANRSPRTAVTVGAGYAQTTGTNTGRFLEIAATLRELAPDVILVDLRRRGHYSVETYSRIARASTSSRIASQPLSYSPTCRLRHSFGRW